MPPVEKDTFLCIDVVNGAQVLPIFDFEDWLNNLEPDDFSNDYILNFVKKDEDYITIENLGFYEWTVLFLTIPIMRKRSNERGEKNKRARIGLTIKLKLTTFVGCVLDRGEYDERSNSGM